MPEPRRTSHLREELEALKKSWLLVLAERLELRPGTNAKVATIIEAILEAPKNKVWTELNHLKQEAKSRREELYMQRQSYFYQKWSFWVAVAGVLIAAITFYFTILNPPTSENNPPPTATNNAAELSWQHPSGSILNILLLPFQPDAQCHKPQTEYERQIYTRLVEKADAEGLRLSIDFVTDESCPILDAEAEKIARKRGKNLVIWGFFDEKANAPTRFRLRSLFLGDQIPDPKKSSDTGYRTLNRVTELQSGYLQKDIDYIIHTLLAQYELARKQFREALRRLEPLIEENYAISSVDQLPIGFNQARDDYFLNRLVIQSYYGSGEYKTVAGILDSLVIRFPKADYFHWRAMANYPMHYTEALNAAYMDPADLAKLPDSLQPRPGMKLPKFLDNATLRAHHDRALADADRAIGIDAAPQYLAYKAELLNLDHQYRAAMHFANRALAKAQDPYLRSTLLALTGNCKRSTGNLAGGIADLEAALKLNPYNEGARLNLEAAKFQQPGPR